MLELQIFTLQTYLLGTILAIFIYNIILYLWNRRFLYYSSWKMDGPLNLPLIGYGWKFLGTNQDMYNVINNIPKIYKTPAAVWLGPDLYFILTDPKHFDIILNKALNKSELIYKFMNEAFGNGLVTAPVDKWKRHRKLIQPTFNQKILNGFLEIFSEETEYFVKDLKKFVGNGFIDIFPVFDKLIMNISCRTLMGNVLNKEKIPNCHKSINTLLELVFYRALKIWYHPKILWNLTSHSKEFDKCVENMNEFIKEVVIQKRREYKLKMKQNEPEENKPSLDQLRRKGFLDQIVEISEESKQLTNDEIIDEAKIVLTAATDTTAGTSSFVMLMLGLYKDIQHKIFEELYSIFGDSDRPAELEDLNKMVYLECTIKETMRLCPVAPFLNRKLDEDIQLDSHTLPKGSTCVVLLCHTYRDPKIWKDPLKFDPNRFLPEESLKRHPYAFIPFSAGPRNCIGGKFALMLMKVILSTLLRSYKVSTSYKTFSDIKLTQAVTLKCADGFNIALEDRN